MTPKRQASHDILFMRQALAEAEKGLFTTTPNPRVGCVFVQNGGIVVRAHHIVAGGPHAETQAIYNAGERGIDLKGSTAYVTLEPCSHHGRTGPCAHALVQAGIRRVVLALIDPNPLVGGKGLAILQQAHIETTVGVLEEQARWLNRGFLSRMVKSRPWVRLKVASSADGITALNNGQSQWITGDEARLDGHYLRAQACAVLTGIGTVKADNPQLNVRGIDTPRQPLKVVVDSHFEISPEALLLQTGKVLIAHTQTKTPQWLATHPNASNIEALRIAPVALGSSEASSGASQATTHTDKLKIDLVHLLHELGIRGINELHLEAGASLNGAFLQTGLVDEIVQYIAPRFLGTGQGLFRLPEMQALPTTLDWAIHSFEPKGHDLRIVWVRPPQE